MDPVEIKIMPHKQVLIVDQERFSSLISKMLADEFITLTATDGLQAIRHVNTSLPDAIVIEQNIPGNGLRLAEILSINPATRHIPMILMSVTPSPDIIIKARQAGINTFLAKPFRPSELKKRLDTILSLSPMETPSPQVSEKQHSAENQDETRNTIQDSIRKIDGLPPFPATHAQILEMANSDRASSDDIAEQLQMDPSLLATVFKIVNSSAYGFQKKVDSLKLAVTLLGLEEIANLVMTAQVFKNLGTYDDGSGLDRTAFWKHSVGTAFITRTIAKKLQTEIESAFLAGMLHDLGKVVLDRCFGQYYQAVFNLIQQEKTWIYHAEKQILGLCHTDVGAQLATEWKFSEKYLYSIKNHHDPSLATRYKRLVSLVHIADIICRRLNFGSGGDDTVPDFDEAVLQSFALGERGLTILIEASAEELESANAFLSAMATG